MAEGFFGRRSQGKKGEMAFVDHLEELRWHIIRSLIVVMIFAVLIFIKIQWVFDNIIAGPINPNFISYRAICRLSHLLKLGDQLCLPPVTITMQTTTFGGQFFSSFSIYFLGVLAFCKTCIKAKRIKRNKFYNLLDFLFLLYRCGFWLFYFRTFYI